jgi:hypothetical protein
LEAAGLKRGASAHCSQEVHLGERWEGRADTTHAGGMEIKRPVIGGTRDSSRKKWERTSIVTAPEELCFFCQDMDGKGKEGTYTPPRMKPFDGSAPRDAWFPAICFLSADEYERNELRIPI